MRLILLSLTCFFIFQSVKASDSLLLEEQALLEAQAYLEFELYADSIIKGFQYDTTRVTIGNDLATISIPSAFKYLNGESAETVLVDLWGNPPSSEEYKSLGMLFPRGDNPMSDSSFAINITYVDDGYIDDADAAKLDYDELLESMQEDTREASTQREELGYGSIELLGWASAPYYDSENKKLHWAQELRFDNSDEHTLNYNIRVLGRKGYLELNVIGGMYVLEEVEKDLENILNGIQFNEGYTYWDFDPNLDEVAAYGIGGLIAGKVLAKAGILAKLGIFLAKFWKIALLGIVGFFGGIKKFFTGKKTTKDEEEVTSIQE